MWGWGFFLILGIVLAIALILMPLATRPDAAPRRNGISKPVPRKSAPAARPGSLPLANAHAKQLHDLQLAAERYFAFPNLSEVADA